MKTISKWELRGIVTSVGFGVLLLVPQLFLHNDAAVSKLATRGWLAIASPVLAIWESLGFRGVEDLHVVIAMVGSVLGYLAGIGFITGMLMHRLVGSIENPRTTR